MGKYDRNKRTVVFDIDGVTASATIAEIPSMGRAARAP